MKTLLTRSLCALLALSLSVLPFPKNAEAQSLRRIALIQVYHGANPTRDLDGMREKIAAFLDNSSIVKVVPREAKVGKQYKIKQKNSNRGENLYEKAKAQFINFKFNDALETVQTALDHLYTDPGHNGGLVKAHLLQAGIFWELGNNQAADETIKKAVTLNLDQQHLDGYYYSNKMVAAFSKSYQAYIQEYKPVEATIHLRNGSVQPIYINGFLRGTGPTININVPRGEEQIIQVGQNTFRYLPSPTSKKEKYEIDNTNYATSAFTAIQDNSFQYLVDDAQSIGKTLGVDQVVFIKIRNKDSNTEELLVKLVSPSKQTATMTKYFAIHNMSQDGDLIARLASEYILSIDGSSGFDKSYSYSWDLVNQPKEQKHHRYAKKKPKSSNGVFGKNKKTALIIAGASVIVLGTIIGAVAASGGGGGSSGSGSSGGSSGGGSSDGTTTTIFSGPTP